MIDSPPAAAPRSGLSTAAKVAIAVVAVVVVGVVAVGGVAVVAVGAVASDRLKTVVVLDKARADNNAIAEQLKQTQQLTATALSGSNPDYSAIQTQIQGISAQFGTSAATIASDLESLRAEDARIKTSEGSLQGTLDRSQYEADRKRVESAIAAFAAVGELFGVLHSQFTFYDRLVGASLALRSMTLKANSQDFPGALALYPPLEEALSSTVAAAADPSVAPQYKALTTALQAVTVDFKAFLLAAQARDFAGANAALTRIKGDQPALSNFDGPGFRAWEKALVDSYRARYDDGLRGAGFKVVY